MSKNQFNAPNLPGFSLPTSASVFPRHPLNHVRNLRFIKNTRLTTTTGIKSTMRLHSKKNQLPQHELDKIAAKIQFGEWATKPRPKPMTVKEFYASFPVQESPVSKYDGVVLTFDAYLKESAPEGVRGPAVGVIDQKSNEYAIRRVIVKFYMEDNTVAVIEPPVLNSGLVAGPILKRQLAKQHVADDRDITLDDIEVGKVLVIYGKEYHIVAADRYTEKFVQQEFGRSLNPQNEQMPSDPYVVAREQVRKVTTESHAKKADDAWLKEKHRRFVKDDRKVLRFFCVWDDRESMFGQELNYYLVDDTVEVVDGAHHKVKTFENPSILLRRQILPKEVHGIHDLAGTTPLGTEVDAKPPQPSTFYSWRDFKTGITINVLGRKFFVTGVDAFTKEYYLSQGFNEQDLSTYEGPHDHIHEEETKPLAESNDDFWLKTSKQHQRNFQNMIKFKGQSLTFSASLATPRPQDANRKFVISFLLGEEMISVFDPAEKLTGSVGGGKLAERAVCINPLTKDYYRASDFYIDAQVQVFGRLYRLEEADEFTFKFMRENVADFPSANLQLIKAKLVKNGDKQRFVEVVGNQTYMSVSGFSNLLKDTGLSKNELAVFCHSFLESVHGQQVVNAQKALESF